MNPIGIIFFDIDGTLVDPATGCVSEKTYEALYRLRQNGILLCLATGRGPAALPDFGGFLFDAYCVFNGSLCYTRDETIHSHPLSPADVAAVLKNAEIVVNNDGTTSFIPNESIFLAALIALVVIVPVLLPLFRMTKKR